MVLYRVVWCGIMLYGVVSCCSVLYIDIYIYGWGGLTTSCSVRMRGMLYMHTCRHLPDGPLGYLRPHR